MGPSTRAADERRATDAHLLMVLPGVLAVAVRNAPSRPYIESSWSMAAIDCTCSYVVAETRFRKPWPKPEEQGANYKPFC